VLPFGTAAPRHSLSFIFHCPKQIFVTLWFSFQTLSGWKKPAALQRSAMLLLQTAQTQGESLSHTTAMGSACSDDSATNSCAAANKKIKSNQIK